MIIKHTYTNYRQLLFIFYFFFFYSIHIFFHSQFAIQFNSLCKCVYDWLNIKETRMKNIEIEREREKIDNILKIIYIFWLYNTNKTKKKSASYGLLNSLLFLSFFFRFFWRHQIRRRLLKNMLVWSWSLVFLTVFVDCYPIWKMKIL